MKGNLKLLILCILMLRITSYSFTQHIPDSLFKYMEIAVENNPAVLQKFSEYEAALKKVPQLGSLPDPQLDIGFFLSPMELLMGYQIADIRLMQMFPWFGVLKNAKDEMSLMAKAKFEVFRDSRLQLYYDVQKTWYELFRLRKEINISQKNIDILKVIEQVAIVRFKSEGTELSDLYRIQIEIGELENKISGLHDQEQTIIARFNNYLNRAPKISVYTPDFLLSDTLALDISLITDSIRDNNPLLNMAEYEYKAYLAQKKMVTKMGAPMLGVGLNYSILTKNDMSVSSMNGKDMLMPMVSITLPIYRKKYRAMQEEAELLSKASLHNYQSAANSLNTEYYDAVRLYQDALRRIKLYENQYMLASKSLEIMLKSFSTSVTSITDVLKVRQQTLDYELKQIEAITDLNIANAWISRLMANTENQ